jgi:hypothetical protein
MPCFYSKEVTSDRACGDFLGPIVTGTAVGTLFGMDWQFCEGEITDDNILDIYELLKLLWVV